MAKTIDFAYVLITNLILQISISETPYIRPSVYYTLLYVVLIEDMYFAV